jgi:hypothetical protein
MKIYIVTKSFDAQSYSDRYFAKYEDAVERASWLASMDANYEKIEGEVIVDKRNSMTFVHVKDHYLNGYEIISRKVR